MPSSKESAREAAALGGPARERYVQRLFDRIALPYDRLNRAMSLGRDERWRRRAAEASGIAHGGRACDLGTGTGDLAFAFAEAAGTTGRVLGVDLARAMLARALQKGRGQAGGTVGFARANAARLPLPDGWADAVGMGWCLRNVGDRPAVYREVLRVLRPEGRLVVLDTSRPRGPLRRAGFWLHRHLGLPILVALLRGDREAYRYLATSTDRFPEASELEAELRDAGFREVRHQPFMLGAIALHVARR